MTRVFVDTNVLFPFSVMDLMLALTEDSVHEVLWSKALLAEWERFIVREQRRSAASAAEITAAIREYFADSEVPEPAYAHLIDQMPGKDPDDRVHMAAAVAGGAAAIVTWNLGGQTCHSARAGLSTEPGPSSLALELGFLELRRPGFLPDSSGLGAVEAARGFCVAVDVRPGPPTFGRWEGCALTTRAGRAVP